MALRRSIAEFRRLALDEAPFPTEITRNDLSLISSALNSCTELGPWCLIANKARTLETSNLADSRYECGCIQRCPSRYMRYLPEHEAPLELG
jgi:hypothetical protein